MAQYFVGIPKRPVIVIPGTGGSANWPCFLYEWACPISSAWGWAPTADKYYVALLDHLRAAGYTEGNEHLNIFFYDWRRPPAENAGNLQDRINQVKPITGSPTVDLVAHSQGGLVARAYIQGTDYANDVAHLITLGTPHRGIPYLYADVGGRRVLRRHVGRRDRPRYHHQALDHAVPGTERGFRPPHPAQLSGDAAHVRLSVRRGSRRHA